MMMKQPTKKKNTRKQNNEKETQLAYSEKQNGIQNEPNATEHLNETNAG